jgi:hypothetical protein
MQRLGMPQAPKEVSFYSSWKQFLIVGAEAQTDHTHLPLLLASSWMLLRTSPIRRLSVSIVTDGSEMIRMRRQAGFFDVDDRLKPLSDLGDQLEAFEAAVEFEAFRPELNVALTYSDGTQGGRPHLIQ